MASTEQPAPPPPPQSAKDIEDALAMPPPPLPASVAAASSVKDVILEPELNALHDCLKNAVAQTGLVYKFYATTFKSGIRNVQPPLSLTAALGREVEKYDQICDSIEAQILRALAVLQRDLAKEQKRIQDEEAALLAQKEQQVASPEAMIEDDLTQVVTVKEEEFQPSTQNSSPMSATHLGRRPSAISISSLHRPAFPHKLDLSSVSFRMPPEDSSHLQSGLASPVTLAPKSARVLNAGEHPSDFLSSYTASSSDAGTRQPDIDLTLPEIIPSDSNVDVSAGDSSDKPIELDLDGDLDAAVMSGLFGEAGNSSANASSTMPSDTIFTQNMPSGGPTAEGKDEHDIFKHLEDGSALGINTQQNVAAGTMFASTSNANTASAPNFDFETIDLTLDNEFFQANPPNPEINFADFQMGDVSDETKNSGS